MEAQLGREPGDLEGQWRLGLRNTKERGQRFHPHWRWPSNGLQSWFCHFLHELEWKAPSFQILKK